MWKEINQHQAKGAYRDEGQGSAVVLLHGFPENNEIWDQQAAGLSQRYRVILPDLPGSGRSPIATPLTIDTMAEFVIAILQQENINSAVVIGHSMGGYVALGIAALQPSLVKGLGLFHSTALADADEKKEARRKSIKLMEQYGSEAFVRQALPAMFSPATRSAHPELVEDYINMGARCQQETLIGYYEAMIDRPDRTAVLEDARFPVLFVMGKDDTAVPMNTIWPQAVLPATSSIHVFNHTGHMGMWESTTASSQVLQEFIDFSSQLHFTNQS
ncbi:Pimeloyl-ACP methyl ester carboxylesterase [Chitinophaga costaii]|uniref:Pimeloyl-ACP methyl ester carboxylesterase n=1 Tax=Chitinophaga costaii TaxID=1335309 RepID=A0A1C4BWG1_9BACT|nr:alpha/beta hydrolase [Chitinophaga costaii]PUZ27442.1 alpha/beta hydrolase [Chitinophaga costaii]SCC11231.1 Pimeloyl-ACP methyl ester carboxylesterase [Chitinophaga costaii]